MKGINILAFLFSVSMLVSCTDKGCTDESAVNFKITATKDDGSCIYCSKETDTIGSVAYAMTDFNNGSIHYLENVVAVQAVQTEVDYNDGGCGTEGCIVSLRLSNLVAEDIHNLQFSSWFQPSSGFGFTFQSFDGIDIPAGQTFEIPMAVVAVSNACNSISGSVVTTNIFSISYN